MEDYIYIEYLQECYNNRACNSDGDRIKLLSCKACKKLMDYEDLDWCVRCNLIHCNVFCRH